LNLHKTMLTRLSKALPLDLLGLPFPRRKGSTSLCEWATIIRCSIWSAVAVFLLRTLTALRKRQGSNLHASIELATWFRIRCRRHLSAGSSKNINARRESNPRWEGGLIYHT
jgi:hypothetical protein